MLSAVSEWLEVYPDDAEFWIEHGIGRRLCAWLAAAHQKQPDMFKPGDSARTDTDARRLEETLAGT